MSVLTPTAGYPVHAIAKICRWESGMGSRFTSWRAQCGARGDAGTWATLDTAGSARRLELCEVCFPGRNHNACKDVVPIQVTTVEELG